MNNNVKTTLAVKKCLESNNILIHLSQYISLLQINDSFAKVTG